MTEENQNSIDETGAPQSPGAPGVSENPGSPKKSIIGWLKHDPSPNPWGGIRMWATVMVIYMMIFGYIGYIAFWPMAFNDPDNTVKKYLSILEEFQTKHSAEGADTLKLAIEELMKKADESSNDMQQLASQSFNIVLGALLAFLSATVTTIFQGINRKNEPLNEGTRLKEEAA